MYRPNVGIALFDSLGRVLIGQRLGDDGPEIVEPGRDWQMPQGGVDPGEDIRFAAKRELREETGVTSAVIVSELPGRMRYDFPPYSGPPHRLARFRGQEQAWVAMRFLGEDEEIDLCGDGSAPPEFGAWRWEPLAQVAALVVSFRRPVYERVAAGFAPVAEAIRSGALYGVRLNE